MDYMQPEITERDRHWRVETSQGTWYVPGSVAPVPDWIKVRVPITEAWLADFENVLGDYIEPKWDYVNSIEVVEGYCGRMQAPGYLDCTDWNFDSTFRGIKAQLRDQYGD